MVHRLIMIRANHATLDQYKQSISKASYLSSNHAVNMQLKNLAN